MLTNEKLKDLEVILLAQYHILSKISSKIDSLESAFSNNEEVQTSIEELEKIMEFLEENADLIEEEAVEDWNEEDILAIYNKKNSLIKEEIEKLEYIGWDSYVCECIKYCSKNNIEPFVPYEMFLSEEDLELIKSESYKNKYKWDKIDYIMVGIAGIIAALTDIFIVAIPKDMTEGKYKGQKGSKVTEWLQSLKLPDWAQKWLEEASKVPYDKTGGSDHRADTIGHDPILGLIFGVIDIMLGNSTSIKGGEIKIIKGVAEGASLIEAILKEIIHLLSDVATKKGIPVPFNSLFRLLDIGSFKRTNGKTATISDLAMWMYHYGYDLRHFVTMSITPATIEIIIRAYVMIRHYMEGSDEKIKIGKNPKYRSMLLSAHAIASAANVGKVTLKQGNPLAINYAEWLALIRYLVPSLKYWIFDKDKLELEHLEKINSDLWDELTLNSFDLLNKINYEEMPVFELGEE